MLRELRRFVRLLRRQLAVEALRENDVAIVAVSTFAVFWLIPMTLSVQSIYGITTSTACAV